MLSKAAVVVSPPLSFPRHFSPLVVSSSPPQKEFHRAAQHALPPLSLPAPASSKPHQATTGQATEHRGPNYGAVADVPRSHQFDATVWSGQGNAAGMMALLSRRPTLVTSGWSPYSPLHLCAQKGYHEKLEGVLLFGGDVDALWNGRTALYESVQKGHLDCIKFLVHAGADVNKAERVSRRTPLHASAMSGAVECLQLLIANGADVNRVDKERCSPLHWAAERGHVECVRKLIGAGANVDKASLKRRVPLLNAVENGHVECVQLFIEAGADVNKANDDGDTPLNKATEKGEVECVQLLLDAGADVNKADRNGFPPLWWAAVRGKARCMKLLIRAGADVNKVDRDGQTAYHAAVARGFTECASILQRIIAAESPVILSPSPSSEEEQRDTGLWGAYRQAASSPTPMTSAFPDYEVE